MFFARPAPAAVSRTFVSTARACCTAKRSPLAATLRFLCGSFVEHAWGRFSMPAGSHRGRIPLASGGGHISRLPCFKKWQSVFRSCRAFLERGGCKGTTMPANQIQYSEKYYDSVYEVRPQAMVRCAPALCSAKRLATHTLAPSSAGRAPKRLWRAARAAMLSPSIALC